MILGPRMNTWAADNGKGRKDSPGKGSSMKKDKEVGSIRYLQVVQLGLGDRAEGDTFPRDQNRGKQIWVKRDKLRF